MTCENLRLIKLFPNKDRISVIHAFGDKATQGPWKQLQDVQLAVDGVKSTLDLLDPLEAYGHRRGPARNLIIQELSRDLGRITNTRLKKPKMKPPSINV